jgi:hypothetical protein
LSLGQYLSCFFFFQEPHAKVSSLHLTFSPPYPIVFDCASHYSHIHAHALRR